MIVMDPETERFLGLLREDYPHARVHEVFPVHLPGWEPDSRAAVVSTGDVFFIMTTSCRSLLRLRHPGGYLGDRLRAHTDPQAGAPLLSLVA